MVWKKVKQLFCCHEWQKKRLAGFLVIDGWLQAATVYRCKKCGKFKKQEDTP